MRHAKKLSFNTEGEGSLLHVKHNWKCHHGTGVMIMCANCLQNYAKIAQICSGLKIHLKIFAIVLSKPRKDEMEIGVITGI